MWKVVRVVLGVSAVAVPAVMIVALLVVLNTSWMVTDPDAEAWARDRAELIAQDVNATLGRISGGLHGEAGVNYLIDELDRKGGTVLGSHAENSTEKDGRLVGWVDARFDVADPAEGGDPYCLRFEVSAVYSEYVSYHEVDCP
ncbi:hypothetical protein ACIA8K_09795 [Catenuloplanes sp. NPDC051500]|uniref:hypothetical protein n=1 Tax=Catenuloplanes sp. NPDC051500 TaxID=3363959 RepID=UPI00378D58BF